MVAHATMIRRRKSAMVTALCAKNSVPTGEALKAAREGLGMSVCEAAGLGDVSARRVQQIEADSIFWAPVRERLAHSYRWLEGGSR